MNLQSKTVFITGGSSGLGLALVKAFLEKGSKVITNGTSKESLRNLEKISSPNLTNFILNIRDHKAVKNLFKQIPEIDILINNAGVWYEDKIGNIDPDRVKKTIETNINGMVFCTNEIAPQMAKRNEGLIINIISTSGLKGRGGQTVYAASKYGARGFTDALRDELIEYGVDVVGVYPGGMSTKFFEKGGHPKENADWMDTSAVARTIIHISENRDCMIVNDITINRKVKEVLSWK